ncbi:RNaseH domain-containing protein [Streptomyces sp. WMMC500]|uniref:RNaseH domain-containing protein n=1 Tax=Streptomyces sp. WMMC500 TaxID=3015154 RepID=UPI00248B8BF3|nr:RNaseH domain-containing protein [Streptomyces sp. WMMC500]WBB61931.1 RNaseH domain-containing protein [Streptomyces sp. WMMC500]
MVAPKEQLDEERHRGKQRAGIAKGLWVPESEEAGQDNRVFYSTADKDSKHTGISVEAAKLTPHVNENGKNEYRPTKNASNPDVLEITAACLQPQDDAETWAMFAHLQRMCDDDYRDVLGLPLVLHLASLADEYGIPHDGDEVVEPDEEEQLTFDFSGFSLD